MGILKDKEGDFFNGKEYSNNTFEVTGISQKEGKKLLQEHLSMKRNSKNFEFSVSISLNDGTLELTSDSFVIDPQHGALISELNLFLTFSNINSSMMKLKSKLT